LPRASSLEIIYAPDFTSALLPSGILLSLAFGLMFIKRLLYK
jgi:hypothetical protein